jgi:thiamine-monophosphate kinase
MRGFEDFAERYKCDLLGGDTSVYGKDLVVVVTVVAELVGENLKRCDVKVGDGIFLTKKVGEAFLDFERTKRGNWEENEYLMPSLVRIWDFSKINASMDVSDGLVKDAGRMGVASKVLLEIDYKLLPSSVEITREMLEFGDDYNVLMTTEQSFVENAVKVGVVRESLGKCGVVLKNLPFEVKTEGFDHFE